MTLSTRVLSEGVSGDDPSLLTSSLAPERPRFAVRALSLETLILLAAIIFGFVVRLILVFAGDGFPLNDGGLFYVMVEDLKANDYRLPQYTSYNGGQIPYAYPPAIFYLTGAASSLL